MRAKKIAHGYYEVVDLDNSRWYTASLLANGLWFVVNHKGRAIQQQSAVHRAVTRAISESAS